MLVYLRESQIEELLRSVDESCIPQHIAQRFQEEQQSEEILKNEKKNAHLYYTLNIICSVQLADHEQLPKFDLIDLLTFQPKISKMNLSGLDFDNEKGEKKEENKLIEIKIKKTAKFSELFEKIEKLFGIRPDDQRLWLWIHRQNGTYRPYLPLPSLYSIINTRSFLSR